MPRRHRGWLLLLAMSAAASTLWSQERTVRPARPVPTAAAPTSFLGVKIPIRTAKGRGFVTAVVRNGVALYQGDIELGDPGDTTERSLGLADKDLRWPGGIVPYSFADEVTAPNRETLRRAMTHIEERTPVRFVERTTTCVPGPHLIFVNSSDPGVSSSKVGRQDGCQRLRLWPGHNRRIAIHELGHTLGLEHVQTRPDRDAFVQVLWNNIREDAKCNFEILDDDDALNELSPYDYASIMHYRNDQFCLELPVNANVPCVTLLERSDPSVAEPNRDFGGDVLSPEDVNVLNLMYAQPLGKNESGDSLGSALVLGDFDDDGYSDMVMGAPGERVRSGPRSGALFVFKGTAAEPTPWAVLTEETPHPNGSQVAGNEADDQLGTALVAADFDHDGFTDLAAGVPNKAPGNGPRSGGVMLYFGSRQGLRAGSMLTLADLGLLGGEGDRFGASLAVMWTASKLVPDLVVGAPGRGTHGSAFVVAMGPRPVGTTQRFTELHPDATPGQARFGTAVEVADLNGDGKQDLLAGAPRWGANGAGAVYVFLGNGSLAPTRFQRLTDPAGVRFDEFGAALAALPVVPGDGWQELVVGAPGKKQGGVATGAVLVFAPKTGGATLSSYTKVDDILPGSTTDPQGFGQTLTTGSLIGNASIDLVVGAPGHDGGAGRVLIMTPRAGRLVRVRDVKVGAFAAQPRFGSAIALGAMNVWPGPLQGEAAQHPNLFVGAPAAALGPGGASAGLVYAFNSAPTDSFPRGSFHQERSSPWSAD